MVIDERGQRSICAGGFESERETIQSVSKTQVLSTGKMDSNDNSHFLMMSERREKTE